MVNLMKSTMKLARGGAASGRQTSSKEAIFVRSGQHSFPLSHKPPAAPRPPPPQRTQQRGATRLPTSSALERTQQRRVAGPPSALERTQQRRVAGPPSALERTQQRRLTAAAVVAARSKPTCEVIVEDEADDVIDLGAPRRLRYRRPSPVSGQRRACRPLLPNPRLYPGPQPKRARRAESRARRSKRTLRRPVPNSRLYRPAPPRPLAPPPPPPRPRAAWPPPAPPRALDTASRALLRLAGLGAPRSEPAPPPPPARASSPAARLVVTLPEAAARYLPASEHFRARRAAQAEPASGGSTPPAARPRPRAMEAAGRQSASPDDRSEGNETLSAPSEFLAEFLSAIMRRQYAEALKYCRLILQYEPHNATARGFYPLLRTKVARAQRTEAAADGADSSSDEACAGAAHSDAEDSPSRQEAGMERSASGSEGGSEASAAGDHSELELDSSDALHSEPSCSLSRRTDSASASASAGCWESSGSASRSDAGADDNGNAAPALPPLLPDDLENDNTAADAGAGGGEPHRSTRLKSESVSSLRRLRAQFACSIK